MAKQLKIDKPFLLSVLILSCAGFFIFVSASLGLLTKSDTAFASAALNQFIALVIGLGAMALISRGNYKLLKQYAFYIFAGAIFLNLLLFVPHIALEHGGAVRWINLGFVSVQPSEFLKIAYVIYFAAWLAGVKEKITEWKYGLAPFMAIVAIIGALLLKQSDTNTLMVLIVTGVAMFVNAGGRYRDIVVMGLATILCIGAVIYVRPYARQRIMTFVDPSADALGSGYQIQQSLIAIGSGGLFGRGFGQSVQKFSYLPEPTGDSIFAVASEEFGFVGSSILICLFIFFCIRGLKIATRITDPFGRLLTVGIVILITIESYVNIAAMLGVIPLTGKPLLFVSHGGTALVITLAQVGIILAVSRHQSKL